MGSGRPGELALKLLATPLNLQILRSLASGPRRLADLRRVTGLPAQTTLRGHLANLEAVGAVAKRPSGQAPYSVETALKLGGGIIRVAIEGEEERLYSEHLWCPYDQISFGELAPRRVSWAPDLSIVSPV